MRVGFTATLSVVLCLSSSFDVVDANVTDPSWNRVSIEGGAVTDLVAAGDDIYLLSGLRIYVSHDDGDSWDLVTELPSQVSSLAIDGDLMLAGTTRHGVMRSTDGGVQWEASGLDFGSIVDDATVTALVFTHDSAGHIIAGTYGRGIHVSIDGGKSWTAASELQTAEIGAVAVDPDEPETVYIGTYRDGIYRMTDGINLEYLALGSLGTDISALAVTPSDPQLILAGSSNFGQVHVSEDEGMSWRNTDHVDGSVHDLTYDPVDNTLYAVHGYTGGPPVSRSTDGGTTWDFVDSANGFPEWSNTFAALVTDDSHLLVATTRGVYRVNLEDDTWTLSNRGLDNVDVRRVALANDVQGKIAVIAGPGTYPYTSEDGGETWRESATSLPNAYFNTVAFNPIDSDEIWLGQAWNEGLLKSTDGGDKWSEPLPFDTAAPTVTQIAINPINPAHVIVVEESNGGVVYVTRDNGDSWTASNDLPAESTSPYATSLVISPSNPDVAYLSTSVGLFKSVDGGESWKELPVDGLVGQQFATVAVDPNDHGIVYASVTGVNVYTIGSTDGGQTWRVLEDWSTPLRIAIDPNDSRRILMASNLDILASTDGGATWSDFAGDLPESRYGTYGASDLQFDPFDSNRHYLVSNNTLYVHEGSLPMTSEDEDDESGTPDEDDDESGSPGDDDESGSQEPGDEPSNQAPPDAVQQNGGGGNTGWALLLLLLGFAAFESRLRRQ